MQATCIPRRPGQPLHRIGSNISTLRPSGNPTRTKLGSESKKNKREIGNITVVGGRARTCHALKRCPCNSRCETGQNHHYHVSQHSQHTQSQGPRLPMPEQVTCGNPQEMTSRIEALCGLRSKEELISFMQKFYKSNANYSNPMRTAINLPSTINGDDNISIKSLGSGPKCFHPNTFFLCFRGGLNEYHQPAYINKGYAAKLHCDPNEKGTTALFWRGGNCSGGGLWYYHPQGDVLQVVDGAFPGAW